MPDPKPSQPEAAPAALPEHLDSPLGEAVPYEGVKPTINPRSAVLKRLGAEVGSDAEHDTGLALDESGEQPRVVEYERAPAAPAAAPAAPAAMEVEAEPPIPNVAGDIVPGAPAPAPAAPPVEIAPPAQPVPGEETITLNVLGRPLTVPKSAIEQAGIEALQKRGAADIYLREASALLDEAQRIRAGSGAPAAPAGPATTEAQDAQALADAIASGDRDKQVAAVNTLLTRGIDASAVEQMVARSVSSQVADVLEHREAVQQLESDLTGIRTNPTLQAMAATEERRLRMIDAQRGVRRSYADVYRDVATNIKRAIPGAVVASPPPAAPAAPTTLQQRREAKAAAPQPVAGAGAAPKPASTTQPRTSQQIVADMQNRRAGGLHRRI